MRLYKAKFISLMKGFKYVTLEVALRPVFFLVEQSSGHYTMDSGMAPPAKHLVLFKAIHGCRLCSIHQDYFTVLIQGK